MACPLYRTGYKLEMIEQPISVAGVGRAEIGNTVARLLRDLQAHVGSDVSLYLPSLEDEELAS